MRILNSCVVWQDSILQTGCTPASPAAHFLCSYSTSIKLLQVHSLGAPQPWMPEAVAPFAPLSARHWLG